MTATREEITLHAETCPQRGCAPDGEDETPPCTGFRAGSLYCETPDCPNPHHRLRPV